MHFGVCRLLTQDLDHRRALVRARTPGDDGHKPSCQTSNCIKTLKAIATIMIVTPITIVKQSCTTITMSYFENELTVFSAHNRQDERRRRAVGALLAVAATDPANAVGVAAGRTVRTYQ